jgi:hypothetical protein
MLMLGSHSASAQAPSSVQAPPASQITPVRQPISAPNGAIAQPGDIRDIRGPKPVGAPWLIPLLAISGLLVAGSGYAAWRRYGRRRHGAAKSPSEVALQRLEQIRALMQPAAGREFSIEVSGIVRDYIESRFRVMAAHRTTDEFLHDLLVSAESSLAGHRELLAEFLHSCDLAKFGGWSLPQLDMEALLQGARRFVIESAPPRFTGKFPKTSIAAAERESYDSIPTT